MCSTSAQLPEERQEDVVQQATAQFGLLPQLVAEIPKQAVS